MCQAAYKSKQNLTSHLLSVHKIGTPYKCECGKEFNWPSKLSEHKNTYCQFLQTGLPMHTTSVTSSSASKVTDRLLAGEDETFPGYESVSTRKK